MIRINVNKAEAEAAQKVCQQITTDALLAVIANRSQHYAVMHTYFEAGKLLGAFAFDSNPYCRAQRGDVGDKRPGVMQTEAEAHTVTMVHVAFLLRHIIQAAVSAGRSKEECYCEVHAILGDTDPFSKAT